MFSFKNILRSNVLFNVTTYNVRTENNIEIDCIPRLSEHKMKNKPIKQNLFNRIYKNLSTV